jgi:ABC-type transporter Mla maintaining outer membrane lipid asymmetry ATPase subunit MlaF
VTSVFVTHDLQAAATLATEYAVAEEKGKIRFVRSDGDFCVANIHFLMLQEGVISFEGSYEELNASSDPYVKLFMS